MLKGKALRKAAKAKDGFRIDGKVPLIQDSTEFITPEIAEKMLRKNKNNRPINWNKVEQYRRIMEAGEWRFHAQGIVLDSEGNLLTGQKRLWAIIYCGEGQYMRVSKGSPPDTAHLLDRGTPQSSRDLASRTTDRKHSPTEASMVRAIFALQGKHKPTVDDIAEGLIQYDSILLCAMKQTRGVKKTKSMLMILGAICASDKKKAVKLIGKVAFLSEMLEKTLRPIDADDCWNRGAAFTLAMEKAKWVCDKELRNMR